MKTHRILEGLLIGLVLLSGFARGAESAKTTVKMLAKTGTSWDGAELPAYPKGKPEVTILRITIPAGAALPVHMHPVINAGVMLEGQLTVHTDKGKTLRLKKGDPIVEVVKTWHYGKNGGDTPAVIVVFYAGTKDTPITVKQADASEAEKKEVE